MKTKLILVLSLIAFQVKAQDPHFSQFYSSSLHLNPALAGAFEHPGVGLGFRYQWPKLKGNFKTWIASYNRYLDKLKGGVGVYYILDSHGDGTLISHSLHLDYSPSFVVGKDFVIKPAIEFAYVYKTIDWSKLTFGDEIDPRYGFVYPTTEIKPSTTKAFADFSSGLLFYHKYFDVGFAAHHLFEPDESFIQNTTGSKLPMKMTIHGSLNLPVSADENIFISPGLLRVSQGDFKEKVYSMTLKISHAILGIGLREKDATLFMGGFESKRLRISYCYDQPSSEALFITGGSHEIFVSYFILRESLKNIKPFMKRIAF